MTARITVYPADPGDRKGTALVLMVHSELGVERVPLTKREALELMRDIIRELE